MTWTEALAFIAGVLAKALVDLLGDYTSNRLKGWILHLAKSRYKPTSIAEIPKEFHCYRIGNLELPQMMLVGSPETPFSIDEVVIGYEPIPRHAKPDYPEELLAARSYLLQECIRKYGLQRSAANNLLARLDAAYQEPETQEDRRGRLYVYFSLTDFFTYLATNRSLDYRVIPERGLISRFTRNRTIREAFVHPPYEEYLPKSVLSNNIGVHIAVISRSLGQNPQQQMIIRRRSQEVAFYRGYYQVSATGFISAAHLDSSNVPNPFYTAVAEAKQEIADSLAVKPKDFQLIGMSISWDELIPVFFGYIETGLSVHDLIGDFKRDAYEGSLLSIPFDPESVLSHIAREKWESPSAMAAIATLLAFYPRTEVEAVARKVPAKNARDFLKDS